MRNYFRFGEYDSRDFGVYIARDGVYNAPRKAYRQISVPGRNGDLLINENRFDNIEVRYPCLIYSHFDCNLSGLKSALLSQDGYVRIADSYHQDEYRLGYFCEEISVIPQILGDGGTFEIVFNCKPQRFLLSGEEQIVFTGDGEIENPTLFTSKPLIRVHFDDADTNLAAPPYYATLPYTHNGVTYTEGNDGAVIANGTATATTRSWYTFKWRDARLSSAPYHLEGCPPSANGEISIQVWFHNGTSQVGVAYADTGNGVDFTPTAAQAEAEFIIQCYVSAGTTVDNVEFKPELYAEGDTCMLWVGDNRITLENKYSYIDIDSDMQDCFYGVSSANKYVQFQSNDFPELAPGETGIILGAGLDSIEITPRWFIL